MSIFPQNSHSAIRLTQPVDYVTQKDAGSQNQDTSEDLGSMSKFTGSGEYSNRPQPHGYEYDSQNHDTRVEPIDKDVFSTFNMDLEDSSLRNSPQAIASYAEYISKRQIVLEVSNELNLIQQNLDVRTVWETLKSKGFHIEPDVVEKVMQTTSMQLKPLVHPDLPRQLVGDRNYAGLFHRHESVQMSDSIQLPTSTPVQNNKHINQRQYIQFVFDLIDSSMDGLDNWWSQLKNPPTGLTSYEHHAPIGGKDQRVELLHSDINRPYIPDYNRPDDHVLGGLVAITLSLRSTLRFPQSPENIFRAANQLKQIQDRLRDVSISGTCLAKVGMGYLRIVEAWLEAYGRQDWILHELLECSTECVYHFGRAGSVYKKSQQLAASRAAEASRDLALLDSLHGDFYVAMSLHYEAVVSLCMVNSDSATDDAAEQLTKSIALFSKTTPPTPSFELEVKRTILSSLQVLGDPRADGQRARLFNEILSRSCTSPDDLLHAEFLEEVATTLFEIQENGSPPNLLDDLLLITKEAIRIFRLYQGSRSSRVRPALTRALKAYAMGLRCNHLSNEATHILEEAIVIQQELSTVDDADASRYLLVLLYDYVGNLLHFQPRTNPLFVDFHPNPPMSISSQADDTPYIGPGPNDILSLLSHHVLFICDLHALTVIRGVLYILVSTDITGSPSTFIVEILKMLLVISDVQRGLGAFDAALQTSWNALLIAIIWNRNTFSISSETYIDVLTSFSHSLLDKDAYGEALEYLTQAGEIWENGVFCKWYHPGSLADCAALSAMVDAHLTPSGGDLSHIDEAIEILRVSLPEFSCTRPLPFWLCSIPGNLDEGSTDMLAWLLLMRAVIRYKTLLGSKQLEEAAEEALVLLIVYFDQVGADLEPYAQASVWGHKCILLSILGDNDAQKIALGETTALYRLALDFQPQMTRLPLLVTLQILQIISRDFADADSVSNHLQIWKRSIYQGSISCFDDIMSFLEDLPSHIPTASHIHRTKPVKVSLAHVDHHAEPKRSGGASLSADSARYNDAPNRSAMKQTDVAVDLPGRTVRFTNQIKESFPSDEPSYDHPKFDLGRIPNLTGRIKIVKGPLRAGGFCDIYSGEFTNEQGSEKVAMKMLRLFNTEAHIVKAKKKFRREVSLWCSLQHPYVLPFYGTCEFDEFRLFMVAPWAEGGNSLEYLQRNPLADRGKLLWQTASALEYLHSGHHAPPIVHGDLKADNVLISIAGDALLCDFGLSVQVEDILSRSGSSSAGRAGGHARFMAPELLIPPEDNSQPSRPTRESDVFAFASLMLQIFTERVPFGDLLEPQAIMKLASGKLPPRPTDTIALERGCVDGIWELMTNCWRFQPSNRPGMQEVRTRIKQWGNLPKI